MMKIRARCPGTCGEMVQGMTKGCYFLVTCPLNMFSTVEVELKKRRNTVVPPLGRKKAGLAVELVLKRAGAKNWGANISINSQIPIGKGMASSSADIAAAAAAAFYLIGIEPSFDLLADIGLAIEPTDGVMYPGIALFDYREGKLRKTLGVAPNLAVAVVDLGGKVDTIEFNRNNRLNSLYLEAEYYTDYALFMVKEGLKQKDYHLLGRGMALSASIHQRILTKPELPLLAEIADMSGAVGYNIAHSGTVCGLFYDADPDRDNLEKLFKKLLPGAKVIHYGRITGGGVEIC